MPVHIVCADLNRETVKPSEIASDSIIFGVCGSVEAAMTATVILRLCKEKGAWLWLTEAEIRDRCRQKSADFPVKLQELIDKGMLHKNEGSLYQVTHDFVRESYLCLNGPRFNYVLEAPQDGAVPA